MTKAFELDWKVPVPKELLDGSVFDRWTEDKDSSDIEYDCLFKVDDCGFFIFWKSEGREGDVLELSQVNDIRQEELPKDERLKSNLLKKHGDNYSEKVGSSFFQRYNLLASLGIYHLQWAGHGKHSSNSCSLQRCFHSRDMEKGPKKFDK